MKPVFNKVDGICITGYAKLCGPKANRAVRGHDNTFFVGLDEQGVDLIRDKLDEQIRKDEHNA